MGRLIDVNAPSPLRFQLIAAESALYNWIGRSMDRAVFRARVGKEA
jgi:hypothetical protein